MLDRNIPKNNNNHIRWIFFCDRIEDAMRGNGGEGRRLFEKEVRKGKEESRGRKVGRNRETEEEKTTEKKQITLK